MCFPEGAVSEAAPIRASAFPVPILGTLLDELDLRRRQIEQGVDARVEQRLQPHDLGGASVVLGAAETERR